MDERDKGHRPRRSLADYPRWMQYLPGAVGGVWLVGCLVYLFRAKVLSPGLSPLGKGILSALCVSGVAFVISALMPLKAEEGVGVADIGNVLRFLGGPAPEDRARLALWNKIRRTCALLLLTLMLWFAWGVAASFGLVGAAK